MAHTNVLDNIFEDGFWQRMHESEAKRIAKAQQDVERQKSFKDCDRCKTSKVYKEGWNVCLSCSYC